MRSEWLHVLVAQHTQHTRSHIASKSAIAFILNGTILPELVYILIKTEAKTITSLLRTLFSEFEAQRMQQFLDSICIGNDDDVKRIASGLVR